MVQVLGLVNDGGAAHHAAVVVDEDVAHDREHPALEVGVVDILVFAVEDFEGGILKQVISIVTIRCEHVGKVQQVALKAHKLVLKFLGSHDEMNLEKLNVFCGRSRLTFQNYLFSCRCKNFIPIICDKKLQSCFKTAQSIDI